MITKNYRRKLTVEDVQRIKQLRERKWTHQRIADVYGVSREHIRDIINGKYWRWLN